MKRPRDEAEVDDERQSSVVTFSEPGDEPQVDKRATLNIDFFRAHEEWQRSPQNPYKIRYRGALLWMLEWRFGNGLVSILPRDLAVLIGKMSVNGRVNLAFPLSLFEFRGVRMLPMISAHNTCIIVQATPSTYNEMYYVDPDLAYKSYEMWGCPVCLRPSVPGDNGWLLCPFDGRVIQHWKGEKKTRCPICLEIFSQDRETQKICEQCYPSTLRNVYEAFGHYDMRYIRDYVRRLEFFDFRIYESFIHSRYIVSNRAHASFPERVSWLKKGVIEEITRH